MKGKLLLLQMFECDSDILNNSGQLENIILKAIDICQMTKLNIFTHNFTPQGVTVNATVSESHIALHTWPEDNYATLTVYTCGDTSLLSDLIPFFELSFNSKRILYKYIDEKDHFYLYVS